VTAPTTAQHAMSLGGALHDMMVALAPGTGVAGAHSAACRDSQNEPVDGARRRRYGDIRGF